MRIALIGRSEILYETGERLRRAGHDIALIITAKEAPEYRRTAEDFASLAAETGATFIRTARIGEAVARVRALDPIDLAVSVNFPGIVPQDMIDCFPRGILNSHAGDLPRYRGNAPLAWALLEGEQRVGLCIHQMVGGELDSGDIIARDFHPVDVRTSLTHLWDWVCERAPALFEQAANRLDEDPDFVLERQSPDPQDALRCYPRRPSDGRIDWSCPALHIVRLVMASSRPLPGAYCDVEGVRTIIWDAEPMGSEEKFLAVPGQVTRIGKGFIAVAAGDGELVRINRIEQDEGEVAPDEVVRSIRSRLS